jgi:small subunit ribosomal protein S1
MSDKVDFASLFSNAAGAQEGRAKRRLRKGEVVEGLVIQIGADSVFLDVGTPGDARLERSHVTNEQGEVTVKVGDTLRATVIDARADAPVLALLMGKAGGELDLASLRLAMESGTPVEGKIDKAVKAGLEVMLGATRAFCPASQVELSYTKELEVYVGQTFEFKILEIRDGGRSVVVSRRALLEARRREQQAEAYAALEPGAEVDGVVQSTNKHGAVIDLGSLQGFAHISELAAHRIARVEDAVNVGDKVRARVLSVEQDARGQTVRLSLKQAGERAEGAAKASSEPDQVFRGKVTRAVQFGIFVQTPRGEGLVPLRELELAPGADHRKAFPVGAELDVVLVRAEPDGRLTFSARAVERVEERRNFREFSGSAAAGAAPSGLGSLGELLRDKLSLGDGGASQKAGGKGAKGRKR